MVGHDRSRFVHRRALEYVNGYSGAGCDRVITTHRELGVVRVDIQRRSRTIDENARKRRGCRPCTYDETSALAPQALVEGLETHEQLILP